MPGSETTSRSSSSNIPPPYTPSYSRVSSFRSPQFEVLLYSPHVTTESTSWATNRTIPVYGDQDVVNGKIIIDSSCRSGRIVLTLTGTFANKSVQADEEKLPAGDSQRHIFFCASRCIDVAASDSRTPNSPSGLRQVFLRRKSRASTADFETRTFPFSFDLGQNRQTGKILPSTFSSSGATEIPVELAYQVTATWEPLQLTHRSLTLTIPVVLQPDPGFHSVDVRPEKPDSWIEIPLKSLRPVPVRCAVTLPSSLKFSRNSSIPYFVVFTTSPRSPALAREIAADATISVSVSSQFFYQQQLVSDLTFSESLATERSAETRSARLKRTVVRRMKSATSFLSSQSADLDPAASTPTEPPEQPPAVSDTQIVYKGMSIGFPKRPRQGTTAGGARGHPSLEAHRALPDGLFKDKIPLNRDMLPSINWGGITLKYFFDVSVLMGQDELRARILLRVT